MSAAPTRRRERGGTLVIALVMLMLMMIHALASFTAADAQLRNTGALQARQEAQAAAQLAIAGVLSSAAFVAAAPASRIDIDVDGDGVHDYRVALAVACTAARGVTSLAVPPASPDDAACLSAATASGDIPCADTTWDIQAVASRTPSSTQTGATVTIHQGVSVRLESSEAMRSCPGLRPGTAVAAAPLSLGRVRSKTYWYIKPGV